MNTYEAKFDNKSKTKGTVKLTLYDKDGNVKQYVEQSNIITNLGREHFVDQLLPSPAQNAMSHYGVGSGSTSPVAGDTTLQTQVARVALESITQDSVQDDIIVYEAIFPAGTGTGTLTEGAIFNAGSGGLMLARSLFDTAVTKGADDTLRVEHSIEFEA